MMPFPCFSDVGHNVGGAGESCLSSRAWAQALPGESSWGSPRSDGLEGRREVC